MTNAPTLSSAPRGWWRRIELFAFVFLVALGATTIVTASWVRDYSQARATLLGSDRGVSVLVTAGAARVLIVNGTDPAALGNAISRARHIGLDRLDLMIVSGNAAAAGLVPRAIEVLSPREVMSVGSDASLFGTEFTPRKVIDRSTEIELPDGVVITIEVWPAADSENDDVTWSALIERGGASIYWTSDRGALAEEWQSEESDVIVFGRGAPVGDTPLPDTRVIVVAGESITGPDVRALVAKALRPEVETKRIFAGEDLRLNLDPEGIRSVSGAIPAGSPTTV